MRLAAWLTVGGGLACALGCDARNARPANSAHPVQGRAPVLVETVGATCAVDDDDDDDDEPEQWIPEDRPPPIRPVEYVKMSEWIPPPSVQALEATVPPRGDEPPTYIQFPKSTRQSSIGAMSSRRH